MHEQFLLNLQNYLAAKEFWIQLCNTALAADRTAGDWVPWIGAHQPGADVFIDEQIYSLYSSAQNKAFYIDQYTPGETDWLIYAMTDKFGEGVLDPPIDYMVIGCILSESTARTAEALITKWVLPTTDFLQMDALISQVVQRC